MESDKMKIIIFLILVLILLTSCPTYGQDIKAMYERAGQGIPECAFELAALDEETREADSEPVSVRELTRAFQEADEEYGEGQGLAECLTNIDSIVEWVKRQAE